MRCILNLLQIYLCKHRLCWALQRLHYILKVQPGMENGVLSDSSAYSYSYAYWGLCLSILPNADEAVPIFHICIRRTAKF